MKILTNSQIKIQPLSMNMISDVVNLLDRVFPLDMDGDARYEQATEYFFIPNYGRLLWKVWVLTVDGKVAGLTGLYQLKLSKEVWLGWFCIDKRYRGLGLGRKLLRWSIREAIRRGFKTLKLYTSTASSESAAQSLYESVGLKQYRSVKNGKYRRLYRRMELR